MPDRGLVCWDAFSTATQQRRAELSCLAPSTCCIVQEAEARIDDAQSAQLEQLRMEMEDMLERLQHCRVQS